MSCFRSEHAPSVGRQGAHDGLPQCRHRAPLPAALLLCLVAALGCHPASPGADDQASGSPAPTQPTAAPRTPALPSAGPTTRDDEAALVRWERRNALEAYDRVGRRSAAWDAKARQYIAGEFADLMGQPDPRPVEAREALGREVLSLGCRDPLVLYLMGLHLWKHGTDPAEAIALLRDAVRGMHRVPYPRAIARYAASALRRAYDTVRDRANRESAAIQEVRWFKDSLRDGSYLPGDTPVVVWQLMHGTGVALFKNNQDELMAALEACPWLDEWARLHFSGLRHSYRAWKARGGEFASDVPPAAWKEFQAESVLARRDLVRAWTLRPDRHEAAYEMIGVATNAPVPGETPRSWFERAVAARLDYMPAYEAMLNQLLPRWGGSHDEMLAFGLACAGMRRFDTPVPEFLLDVFERIVQDQASDPAWAHETRVESRPEAYAALTRMLDGYLSAPARPRVAAYYESLYAIVANRAGRHDVAREHLSHVGFKLHPDTAWRVRERSEAIVTLSAAMGGPAGDTLRQAQVARTTPGGEAALALYRRALLEDPQPASQKWVHDRMASLEGERDLTAGEWISLLPRGEDLAGWDVHSGSASRDADGALVVTSARRGYLVANATRVGPDFEVMARIEWVSSTNGQYQAGLAFGESEFDAPRRGSVWLARAASGSGSVWLARQADEPSTEPVKVTLREVNDVLVRSRGRRLTVSVNGDVVIHDAPAGPDFPVSGSTAIGVVGSIDGNRIVVRYRDLKVRRIARP